MKLITYGIKKCFELACSYNAYCVDAMCVFSQYLTTPM